jgi:succinyl-diaminopimelate desuccinylase
MELLDDVVKRDLLSQIEADQTDIVAFMREFVRQPSPNPPGVTTPAADFVRSFLQEHSLPFREISPAEDRPNFLGSIDFGQGEKHLVLNGHIDVFPVEDAASWTTDPWGGELIDGRIFGRGAADMKCGTTASIWTYLYLSQRAEHLAGRLTLTVVSEEENFSPLGMRYLMDHHLDEVLGTCCLNGEPSSPYSVRFGEKAPLWLKFTIRTRGGHGAFVHVSKNAGLIALDLISELSRVPDLPFQEPAELAAALDEAAAEIDRAYGAGAAKVIRQITFSLGTIRAGVKVNMIAAECEFEADFRVPNGVRSVEILDRVNEIMKRYPEATMEILNQGEPNWCEPNHPMMEIVRENAFAVGGVRPAKVVSPGATDARLWRLRGIPAVVYGPTPNGMGSADEFVSVVELMHVVKCHALSACDYLKRGAPH